MQFLWWNFSPQSNFGSDGIDRVFGCRRVHHLAGAHAFRTVGGYTRARQLQDLQLTWRTQLTQARSSALLLRLADSLFASPVLTIPQAQALLDVTYRSAQQNVEKLIEAGILLQVSEGDYNKTFAAPAILTIISQ